MPLQDHNTGLCAFVVAHECCLPEFCLSWLSLSSTVSGGQIYQSEGRISGPKRPHSQITENMYTAWLIKTNEFVIQHEQFNLKFSSLHLRLCLTSRISSYLHAGKTRLIHTHTHTHNNLPAIFLKCGKHWTEMFPSNLLQASAGRPEPHIWPQMKGHFAAARVLYTKRLTTQLRKAIDALQSNWFCFTSKVKRRAGRHV